ncbi:MAG: 50S ribosomal protein L15 [Candidatus Omnitrophica bacterium CG12_big_fil_rev_8_21_14_0_65_43_15]|uniref:Large ribosomal subunit protein uL15 n=1 Tax=Candidatus Taenaricola geysiri TaxID=1974752 RepID=A0A2J0LL19_9BACT|nr:MAG: 50S ribosomal protein L15 [Candidatus Omnitrophica bacterium CG1_02_43_210]PIR66039.1 MAG: 50S ribosomal protein L15 [Candidatus Omnitrophica bacterium CG10_big_fil_rev_8_21_14_0_10_43_8]PIV12117.1 MAG: 50S ribosomal protein L15 [Candidatus Omnitrophica bacterium CG03_land_8_20_14_0_80_43_22]PIW66740.1 MAG: 50S ribosomal protein L15 [Candidatus Omnitrophica bacterium CG12_big_fil_rev_8_21_14_0_65_43_15]PIW79767.1 MAG: 50S ribosomal protein L15 [Candidatus Omnitrophica bacterium CG_4_8_1
MRLSDLAPVKGSNKKNKRKGCGSGSGHGKTSCRGNKGAGSRSGSNRRLGFEGGQMPLMRRVPKRGFNSKFPMIYEIVNLEQFKGFKDADTVDPKALKQRNIVKHSSWPVKILGSGEIKKALTVHAHKFSKSAVEKITAAGGKVVVLE